VSRESKQRQSSAVGQASRNIMPSSKIAQRNAALVAPVVPMKNAGSEYRTKIGRLVVAAVLHWISESMPNPPRPWCAKEIWG
jgi:hypothetical protein